MMLAYLRESLHWIHLLFFKPHTLEEEAKGLSRKESLVIYLKVFPVTFTMALLLLLAIGGISTFLGYEFNWGEALGRLLVGGLGGGLVGGLGVGLGVGLVGGLGVGLDKGLAEAFNFALSYLITFGLTFFRPFYLFPYFLQYLRARQSGDPFRIFRNSPVCWDEVIAMPLPWLADWLVRLAKHDRIRGKNEILFVAAKRPYQRRAAQKALVIVLAEELRQINSLAHLTEAANILKLLPDEQEYLPEGPTGAARRINTISTLAQDYLTRLTPSGQLAILEELRRELEAFRDAMALTSRPVGPEFQPVAARWLEIVAQSEAECRAKVSFTPIPNPFVVGNPLKPLDQNVFVGRRDIIVAIEENIINANQRPALLLYGRRRAGKSSTLLNLRLLLSSQFVPVYIDCQDAKWRESDATFCYQMAKAIYDELFQRNLTEGFSRPRVEEFEKYAFTKLDEALDRVEELSRKSGKRILLTFDEYEGLEKGILKAAISTDVPDKLRNIIQHRERIVVLVSGSHRFDELRELNWAGYLINARTLELSYLKPDEARELLTRPVPKLHYEPGVIDEILRLTHRQPYLVQAIASDLVNHLNEQQRMTATMDDLKIAVEKVLVTAGSYFANSWREECSDEERSVLLTLATGETVNPAEHRLALRNLCQKEVLERTDDHYQIAIELFRLWILKSEMIPPAQAPFPQPLGQTHLPAV
jgi:hypothetical protein